MIRVAGVLLIFVIAAGTTLARFRVPLTRPFSTACLQIAPTCLRKTEVQSLVCGSSLKRSSETSAWRNLGLIHILVVSGGHLSVLAFIINALANRAWPKASCRNRRLVGFGLIVFSLANQLQAPVLRALLEWFLRRPLKSRGWKPPEIALVSTWIALPFCSTSYDLLSLALSFFASVTVEQTARALYRKPWLATLTLQIAVWWILLPLLFTMGVPHPVTSMANIVLAPLLGATLIPFAMLTWASGLLPWGEGDPIALGFLFDQAWRWLSCGVQWLASILPDATPRLAGVKPLFFGVELSLVLVAGLMAATGALLIRERRRARRESLARTATIPLLVVASALIFAVIVHSQISAQTADPRAAPAAEIGREAAHEFSRAREANPRSRALRFDRSKKI